MYTSTSKYLLLISCGKLSSSNVLYKGPVTPKIFSASWPRRAEYPPVSMPSAEDARFSALRIHPASEWMNSVAEKFLPRFMACDVIFEKFQEELL